MVENPSCQRARLALAASARLPPPPRQKRTKNHEENHKPLEPSNSKHDKYENILLGFTGIVVNHLGKEKSGKTCGWTVKGFRKRSRQGIIGAKKQGGD